jgi:diguanylate cyclase (GGDEF)-like protein/PAS domain S-box-containing protein
LDLVWNASTIRPHNHDCAASLSTLRKIAGARTRWLNRGLEAPVFLPLFAFLLVCAIFAATFHFSETERTTALRGAGYSTHELMDTYEAQVVRNLDVIDQTLKVLRFAVKQKGSDGALPELNRQGLLPSALVFIVTVADADGKIVATNSPDAPPSVAGQRYFEYQRTQTGDKPFVSAPITQAQEPDANIYFSRRLENVDAGFAGTVIIAVNPAYFTSGYERPRLGSMGALALIGNDGIVRALRVGDKVSWSQQVAVEPLIGRTDSVISPWDKVGRFMEVRKLHGFPLNAVVGLSEKELLASYDQRRRNNLLAASVASAGVVLVMSLLWYWSWQGSKAKRRLRREQATYAAASEANLDSFFVLRAMHDAEGDIVDFKITSANSRAKRMTGMNEKEIKGKTLCALLPQVRHNGILANLIHVTIVGGVHEEEWENDMPQLPARWLHRQVVGVEGGVVAIVRDITERREAEERIRFMAHYDHLTALPNRALIGRQLEAAVTHARLDGTTVQVAFIDLDGFKLVNDGLGHQAGDQLLQIVAARIKNCLRDGDAAGRLGGDEFVLVMPREVDDFGAPSPVLDNILRVVSQPVTLQGKEVQISCSIGVAVFPRDGVEPDALLINADAAMYRAKELGKNHCRFYVHEMNVDVELKLTLRDGLRHALDDGQFRILYQPKIDLRTGRIIGVEALVRWHHPEQGVISPLRFIPLAEENGVIIGIGEWVLRTACSQNKAWQKAGHPPITVSVNVSPRQFDDAALLKCVADALRDSELAPQDLELEITESLIMRDLQRAVTKMRELTAMGLSLSIDDFGTGYSSLSSLKTFPISCLKIDKSFVRDLAVSGDDRTIAMAIISLAHQLNMRVIAEGVETDEQCAFLRENGCDEMQGYLFSRPVPPQEIEAMLRAQSHQMTFQHDLALNAPASVTRNPPALGPAILPV